MVNILGAHNDNDCWPKLHNKTTFFIKGRFLLFQVYRNFANLFFKLSLSTFYKEISKFQQKVQS